MRTVLLLMVIFMSGCIATASASNTSGKIDNSPAEKAKREKIRKELCNKHHYPNVKYVHVGGELEILKVHLDIPEQTAYRCKF